AYPEAEQNEILRLGKRSPILNQLTMPELAKVNNNVNERFKSRPEAVRECCETIPEEMRLAVLGHCVEVAIADGTMSQPEAAMIERILEHLHVDTRDAKSVIEVVLLLARY
ncbi:MAG: TerB family tellurite resistance protein, partial [Myxococcota bacterium]